MKNFLPLLFCVLMLSFLVGCEKDEFLQENQQVTVNQSGGPNQAKRSCALSSHQRNLLQDPTYRQKHEAIKRKVAAMGRHKMDCSDPVVLPVAVHFQGVSGGDLNCLRELASRQIEILNADFAGTNADINRWTGESSASFPGLENGEACFRFCLADKNHPASSGLADGDPAVTLNGTNGDNDSNWSGYLNIFVQPNTGVLGYAPLGGSGNGDGVVVDASAFGTGSSCGNVGAQTPFDLGRTLTHEVGHYLLLDHIWGDGCGVDDEVSDTPDSAGPYEGCPNLGQSSCGSTDLHMNYMDYSDDACMYMFTSGQISRSANFLQLNLQNVISNAANVCSGGGGGGGGGDIPTCNDGIQNGTETGVDCGGDCAPCNDPSECAVPANLRTEDLTDQRVTLRWSGSANRYRLKVRPAGTTPWMTLTVNDTSAPLTALAAETTYEWRVRAVCGDETSELSPVSEFTTLEHGCTDDGGDGNDDENDVCIPFELRFVLDDYGSETTWELYNDDNEVVADGGQYQDFAEGTEILESLCLSANCYTLVVYDAAYDGMCCEYGEGYFQLLDEDGSVAYENDGRFGESTEVSFCLEESFSGGGKPTNLRAKAKAKIAAKVAASRAVKHQ